MSTTATPAGWLTSREHLRWAGPWPVEVLGPLAGPVPDRQYVLLQVGDLRLVAADRYDRRWTAPAPGAPREVAVWSRAAAVPAAGSATFAPDRADPDAWCTLCACRDEAVTLAADNRAGHERAGWHS